MRFLKTLRCIARFCIAVLPFAILTGCGDDDGTQPDVLTLADFQGSWEAQSYRVTDAAVPAVTLEIISLGATFEWNVDGAGNFSGSTFIPAAIAGVDVNLNFQGNFVLVGQDSLIINFVPEVPPFLTQTRSAFELLGSTLTLIDSDTTFDFDQDGIEEAAIFEGTLIRG